MCGRRDESSDLETPGGREEPESRVALLVAAFTGTVSLAIRSKHKANGPKLRLGETGEPLLAIDGAYHAFTGDLQHAPDATRCLALRGIAEGWGRG